MKFPQSVTSQKQAKALIEEVFPRPLGYGASYISTPYESSLAVTKARMEQQERLWKFLEWLMGGPKIYKVARLKLSYAAAQRFDENINFLHHAFSSAYGREKAPDFIRRLRDSDA